MPLEIRELVIRAQVGDGAEEASATQQNGSSSGGTTDQATINRIVEKVLEILKTQKER